MPLRAGHSRWPRKLPPVMPWCLALRMTPEIAHGTLAMEKDLSEKTREIMDLLAAGLSEAEVAARLYPD